MLSSWRLCFRPLRPTTCSRWRIQEVLVLVPIEIGLLHILIQYIIFIHPLSRQVIVFAICRFTPAGEEETFAKALGPDRQNVCLIPGQVFP